MSPAEGSLILPDAKITVRVANGIAGVDADTVVLNINGKTVTPEVKIVGRKVTITYSTPNGLEPDTTQAVSIAFKDTEGNEITGAWEFQTAPLIEIANVERVIDFDDGLEPEDGYVYGTAYPEEFGGIEDSGVMTLTINENNENGSFILDDQDAGEWISAFTLAFKLRISGPGEDLEGSSNPADGFSVSLAEDLPEDTWGEAENGAGSGLRFCFDTYDNGGGEAPSIDIRFGTQLIASTLLEKSEILTGLDFVDVFRGLFDRDRWGDRALPQVHCYTFVGKQLDQSEAETAEGVEVAEAEVRARLFRGVVRRVEELLQCEFPEKEQPEIREVRDVAPNKRMVLVSFRVPEAAAFATAS